MAEMRKVTFNLEEESYMRIKLLALENRKTATSYLQKWVLDGLKEELKKEEKREKEQKRLDKDY